VLLDERAFRRTLASVSIAKYLGAGSYLVTASTNTSLGAGSALQTALAKVPGLQNVEEDFLLPSSTPSPTPGAGGNPATLPAAPSQFPALTEIGGAGALVFSGSTSGTITAGSSVSFTIGLDAGQTLAAIVTLDNNLQPTVTITSPGKGLVGFGVGSAPGALTAMQAVGATTSGTYTVTVAGNDTNTAGNFTLQLVLNSRLQNEQYLSGGIDSTLAAAQQIDLSPVAQGNGITRSAVYGNIPLQAGPGDTFVSERGVGIQLVNSAGVIETTLNDSALSAGAIQGIHLGPNNDIYVGVDAAPPRERRPGG
jgi:hypothetical protein